MLALARSLHADIEALRGEGVAGTRSCEFGHAGGGGALDWPSQIVGEFMSRTGYRAFLRDPRGMVDINDLIDPASPWTVEIGNAVNDAGQIAAWGCEKTGLACHALLLNPVPEPDTLALFVAGLGMLGWASRKRHSLS